MRLEDILVRYLPHGGIVSDARGEEQRVRLSLSGAARIEVVTGSADPADVRLCGADSLPTAPAGTTVVQLPATDPPLAALLSWATSKDAQLVEICRTLTPAATVAVLLHRRAPQVPSIPGSPDEVPGDDATWRRLAGELVAQRYLSGGLESKNEDLKRKLRKARRNQNQAGA